MPQAENKSGTWADVVLQLLKTFLILRDIFGYAIPGAVFVAIGLYEKRVQLNTFVDIVPYHLPVWVWMILIIVGCYVLGHILSVAVYLPIDLAKFAAVLMKKTGWVMDHPTEVNPKLLVIRQRHPELFIELDRRETLSILTATMLSALAIGWAVFCQFNTSFCTLVLIAVGLLLLDFLTVIPHLKRVRAAIEAADEELPITDGAAQNNANQILASLLDAAASALRNQKS